MILSCGLCEKSIDTNNDEFLISKRLREQIQSKRESTQKVYGVNIFDSVNFHYDCALEHDELMTIDDFSDRGSERDDYRNDLD